MTEAELFTLLIQQGMRSRGEIHVIVYDRQEMVRAAIERCFKMLSEMNCSTFLLYKTHSKLQFVDGATLLFTNGENEHFARGLRMTTLSISDTIPAEKENLIRQHVMPALSDTNVKYFS